MLMILTAMADSPDDKRKIEQLYSKYDKLMYVVAYKILNHHEDAEDCLVEAWEKVARHLEKINEIDCQETKSSLVIIVERTAIDFYRRNKRYSEGLLLVDECEEHPFYATADKELEKAETYQVLRNIPKMYAETLLLYYVNGFSTKEIAELLNIKEDTVMKRLSRGRKILKKEVSGDE